ERFAQQLDITARQPVWSEESLRPLQPPDLGDRPACLGDQSIPAHAAAPRDTVESPQQVRRQVNARARHTETYQNLLIAATLLRCGHLSNWSAPLSGRGTSHPRPSLEECHRDAVAALALLAGTERLDRLVRAEVGADRAAKRAGAVAVDDEHGV